jgi:hypothetical protein
VTSLQTTKDLYPWWYWAERGLSPKPNANAVYKPAGHFESVAHYTRNQVSGD